MSMNQCIQFDNTDAWQSFLYHIDDAARTRIWEIAEPGYYNDMDALMIGIKAQGNMAQTWNEYRSQFSLFCILASPLIFSADIIKGTKYNGTLLPEMKQILMNAEMIAVDQDPMGKAGHRVLCTNPDDPSCVSYFGFESRRTEVWARELTGGALAVALLNRGNETATIGATWGQLGVANATARTTCAVRDLWGRKDLGRTISLSAAVGSHDTAVLRVTGCRAEHG